jgi:hypothetical protein
MRVTEKDLLNKLEQQVGKIQQLVIDLQKDNRWQRIFYNKKLFLNLNNIFKNNYTEYARYLEDIIEDYTKLVKINNNDIKIYFIKKIESKIFGLFKTLRSLKEYNHYNQGHNKTGDLNNKFLENQQQLNKLNNQKESLEKMLTHLEASYVNLNKQLVYGETGINNQNKGSPLSLPLQQKLLDLLAKKGKFERELFSITEQIKLLYI